MATREYRKVLTLNDFVGCKPTETDILLVNNVWNKLGVYTVPDGVMMAVGARFDGYVYIRLDSTGTAIIHGRVRIKISNPTEDLKNPVLEIHTASCSTPSGKQDKPFILLSLPWAQPNSKLILEFKQDRESIAALSGYRNASDATDRAVTIDLNDANTRMYLDCTYKLV